MKSKGEIKSEKILVKDIFSRMWFRIPEYQRPYVWGREEITELLEDLTFAASEKPDSEYFLGSFVFQAKAADTARGQEFDENDILDGQQRMTTLLMLFAVIRDLAKSGGAKEDCQLCINQKASEFRNIPERTRLIFAIREKVQGFIDGYVKPDKGTSKEDELSKLADREDDKSVKNMAAALLEIRRYFQEKPEADPEKLLKFLLNKVLMIYVSTEDLEDAFRLFVILNDRGVPLRNSDIIKSTNLGALENAADKVKYAKMWEEAEGELGDDFDRFLNHVRTVLVKEKARMSLLQEFEDKIYHPKEKDKATGEKKPVLLVKGRDTFQFIDRYLKHYRALVDGKNYDETGSFEFDNLIKVMFMGLPATDWVPPLLRFYDKFETREILPFLKKLDNKFSADWIGQYAPTDRIDAMNLVIKVIDSAKSPEEVLASDCFKIDGDSFRRVLDGPVYGKKFVRYLLLKLDYYWANHANRMQFETLTVEHILPQTPSDDSRWTKDFTSKERNEWTDKIGNLVLITRRKNSSQGRLDYAEKKKKYFHAYIDTCPNSLRVLQENDRWTPEELKRNQGIVTEKICKQYEVAVV
ncbi:MAG: DUF262 domain-containing HNH endonuclease family protein [Myxococcota bacterium]|jgi:uncharacterized protein with ParB-like and HNH nuclease domain|nr:DUF262 domain-containing HNH endonuclease family protein [Myxococcota bacterium]